MEKLAKLSIYCCFVYIHCLDPSNSVAEEQFSTSQKFGDILYPVPQADLHLLCWHSPKVGDTVFFS